MAQILGLPKLSPTMEEGVLVKWTKKEGDKVSPGDLVAEVETDKANMDFNVEDEGVLLKLLVKEGDTVKLGAPVAIIGKAGEDVSALVAQAASGGTPAKKPEPKAEAKPEPKAAAKPTPSSASPAGAKATPAPTPKPEAKAAPRSEAKTTPATPGARLLASPLAKSLAIELGIDLRTLTGTGPGGRIVERDVRGAADGGGAAAPAPEADDHDGDGTNGDEATDGGDDEAADARKTVAITVRPAQTAVAQPGGDAGDYTDVPASNMRKRIAERLTEAKRDIPHFYVQRELDAQPLLAFRTRLNDLLGDRGKVSVNDLVIKAAALALRRVPDANASWTGDAIRKFHGVHVGVAVALPEGLVTPVIRDADKKGIGAIAAEVKDLATRAKNRGLKSHEITGSTFTVSNLGMFGVERFTAILNPPEAGILAVGAVRDAPYVSNGQVLAGKRLTVSLSCDHRVIDGALGATWLAAFVDLLEKPESLAL